MPPPMRGPHTYCMKCKTWVKKAGYQQSNPDALAAHESSCAAVLDKTMFGQHPDLQNLDSELAEIERFYE